jgi:hypothetical protein
MTMPQKPLLQPYMQTTQLNALQLSTAQLSSAQLSSDHIVSAACCFNALPVL